VVSSSGTAREQSLDDRYGRPSPTRRIAWWIGITTSAVAFLAWVVWAALGSASSAGYGATLRSYDVISPHLVRVQLDVHRAADRPFLCTVTAQADDHSVVGETQVRVPRGAESDLTVTASVKTDREATTAVLSTCR
jgi:Domain of unknown function (DUF4307)